MVQVAPSLREPMPSPDSVTRNRTVKNVDPRKRRVEIAVILLKYGWDTLIYLLSLSEFVPSGLRQKLAVSSFLRQEVEAGSEELPDLSLPLPSVLRQILEELGPTFVKLGQVLSTRPDLLPPEYVEELSKLQEQVRPAPWSDMEQVLLSEWNQRQGGRALATSVRDIFPEFDTIPLAAGSLGQVYKARLADPDGAQRTVIVKLLRPNIEETVEGDIAVLMDFARTLATRTRWGQWNNVEGLAAEFSQVIRNELDFTREAEHTEEIGRNLHRDGGTWIKVPHIHREHSSRRMMTVEFVTGVKVSQLFPGRDGSPPVVALTLPQRQKLAETLTHAFLRQIFVDGFFHADPHPGNVMFQFRDGDTTRLPILVLIDFGMVGRLDPRSRDILIDFLLALLQFDAARATERILEYGFPQQLVDKYRLTVELDHVMREFLGRPVSEVQIGALLNQVTSLLMQYRVRMPTSFLLIARVLALTEGICRQLDPNYMLIEVAGPFITGMMRRQFTDLFKGPELMRLGLDLKNVLIRSPRRFDDLLTALNSGQLRFETEVRHLARLERTLVTIGNKAAFSVLNVGLVLAGALLAPLPEGPHVFGIHVLGLLLLGVSGVLGLGLLWTILRSGTLR